MLLYTFRSPPHIYASGTCGVDFFHSFRPFLETVLPHSAARFRQYLDRDRADRLWLDVHAVVGSFLYLADRRFDDLDPRSGVHHPDGTFPAAGKEHYVGTPYRCGAGFRRCGFPPVRQGVSAGTRQQRPGQRLVLVAVVAIAVNTVIIKPQLQRYGTLVVMGWYYIIGLLITAPFFWKYIADTDFLRLPLSGQAELAYVLVLGTVLPMYLLYRGTEKLTFIHTALYRYIQPVVATVLALVRHQEQIDRTNIIAGVLIFASIILVIREANLRGFFSSVQAPSPTPDGRSRKRP